MANKVVVIYAFMLALFLGVIGNSAPSAQNVIAEVIGEFPYAYSAPDFDSSVIATLRTGSFYYVSKQQFAYGFHKIQLNKSTSAYISSSEIKIVSAQYVRRKNKVKNSNPKSDRAEAKIEEKKPINYRPIYLLRYHGLIIEMQNYTEDTMSKTRSEGLNFFGYRAVGFNTLFSGEMATDAVVMVYRGAPKYYETVTGYGASGWIIHSHFTFDTILPLATSYMASYGFGPMVKYAHFETGLPNPSGVGVITYNLDDLTLGVLFRAGMAVRWKAFSLRTDIKYFIESKHYVGVNVSTLFVF